jgi:hypothetical protein
LPSVEYDLCYLREAIEVLEEYLLSKEIFWPLHLNPPGGEAHYPQLTLGNLLLAKTRLEARRLAFQEAAELTRLGIELERMSIQWRVAWEAKAGRSFSVRLRSWADFLSEYDSQPGNHHDRYAYEVRLRVILGLLSAQAGAIPQAEQGLLDVLDYRLKARLIPAGFIWQEELEPGFPPDEYWYLFGRLPVKTD